MNTYVKMLDELIEDAEKRHAAAVAVAESIPEIESEIAGLRRARSIRLGEETPGTTNGHKPGVPELADMTRPAAILQVLQSARQPLSPKQILSALTKGGRESDTNHNVGTALHRLRARNKVASQGYGRWVAVVTDDEGRNLN